MKQRSVNKVRSTKLAKTKRFVTRQLANVKYVNNSSGHIVWISNVFIAAHTDAQTNTKIDAMIVKGWGTYSRAKHDIITTDKNGKSTIKRYVPA